jgi:hypothetical protein
VLIGFRKNENAWLRYAQANYLLIVHFIIYIATTGLVLSLSDRYTEPDLGTRRIPYIRNWHRRWEVNYVPYSGDYKPIKYTSLGVGAINTYMTILLVIVRIITTSWSATVAWRSVFYLMEKGNIDIRQLNWRVSWKIGRPA